MLHRALCLLSAATVTHSSVSADTLFVDVRLGTPGAPGTQAEPLATVTEAMSRLSSNGPHTVHMGPGTYSVASGEQLPWMGSQSLTILAAEGRVVVDITAGTGAPAAATMIELGGAGDCSGSVSLTLDGLTVLGDAGDTVARVCAQGGLTTRSCVFHGLRWVLAPNGDSIFGRELRFFDTTFEQIELVSVNYASSGLERGTVSTRCMYVDCVQTNEGAIFYGPQRNAIEYYDCLITGTSAFAPLSAIWADIVDGCTVVGNHTGGASMTGEGFFIRNSIIAGNIGDDVWFGDVTDSVVGDGTGTHFGGVHVGDPLLVDAAEGDFRLRYGSPAIDVLPAEASSLDLRGQPRTADGDLDLTPERDLGAFEFRPLDRPHGLSHEVPLGQPYELELRGATGSFSQLLFARAPLTSPSSTPYGELLLDPAGASRVALVQIDPGGSITVTLPLVGGAGLIGTTLSFQALGRTTMAPAGAALTNGLELLVVAP